MSRLSPSLSELFRSLDLIGSLVSLEMLESLFADLLLDRLTDLRFPSLLEDELDDELLELEELLDDELLSEELQMKSEVRFFF